MLHSSPPTTCIGSEHAAVLDRDLLARLPALRAHLLHRAHNVHPLHHLAKNNVLAVEPALGGAGGGMCEYARSMRFVANAAKGFKDMYGGESRCRSRRSRTVPSSHMKVVAPQHTSLGKKRRAGNQMSLTVAAITALRREYAWERSLHTIWRERVSEHMHGRTREMRVNVYRPTDCTRPTANDKGRKLKGTRNVPVCLFACDEELAALRVGPTVGHAKCT